MVKFKSQLALIIFIISACAFSAKAQNNKTGIFGVATITLPGDSLSRWGGYIELQSRSNKFFNQFFYYETKGGISYDIANNYTALLGTGRYVTDENDLGLTPNTEFRMWEQMTVNSFLDRVKFEHRYRAEQRWVNGIYRNRFRYRLNMVIPLNNKKVVPGTFFIGIFDEVFFNNKAPHFERNRFSAGLGYQFDKSFSLQLGWLNQYNYNLSNAGAKNNLAININYRIHRDHAKSKEHIPTSAD
ncbi:DUF2490 domain-containing protein [Mucilaginibacter auburnensis]|uniref:Uncharacterized protein DUF2490 n=1 Tax=Mucilaginibacter auburnensis TaxID=1457233 RepID=A0A2H9VMZ4_9SPHI|nr:DUF2490 domain-containing protein [Mucilaginibacter auburnensis]PJJ79707.1 uncharacterized protein DUF2490 [Mucilaginibacter auburnensis]